MDCPYCKRDIYGMTGLQELRKFEKHLRKCKKLPTVVIKGKIKSREDIDMFDALEIRADSGQ